MHLPHRSLKSIQPLPSIYTAFSVNYDNAQSSIDSAINSGTRLIRHIEDGIEVVPFERCDETSAPIRSPDQDEKEVFIMSQNEVTVKEKPLPSLPKSLWLRMSLRQRVLALLGIQFIMLMTIGLALMAAKHSSSQNDQPSEVRSTSDGIPATNTTRPIRRGIFAVPIQLPQQQSSACLADMTESVAWQCASDTTFQLNIFPSPAYANNNTTVVSLSTPLSNNSITHGHQVPDIQPVRISALGDTALDNNTVYYFRTTYTKVIFLEDTDLAPEKTPRAQPTSRHPTFQSGDSLWRCTFNETLIEGYIYVNQTTTPDITNDRSNGTSPSKTSLPKLPYVIKLVEQRTPHEKSPYCENMTVLADGSLSAPSRRTLLHLIGPAAKFRLRNDLAISARARAMQQTQAANNCTCQWLVQ